MPYLYNNGAYVNTIRLCDVNKEIKPALSLQEQIQINDKTICIQDLTIPCSEFQMGLMKEMVTLPIASFTELPVLILEKK